MSVVIEVAVRRPADPAAQPGQPLLLFLHGFGSHEGDLAGLASFLPNRFDWVSLRAPIGISASGFAWFPITTPGQPEPIRLARG
jgi:phospholipase/carboxylesterase